MGIITQPGATTTSSSAGAGVTAAPTGGSVGAAHIRRAGSIPGVPPPKKPGLGKYVLGLGAVAAATGAAALAIGSAWLPPNACVSRIPDVSLVDASLPSYKAPIMTEPVVELLNAALDVYEQFAGKQALLTTAYRLAGKPQDAAAADDNVIIVASGQPGSGRSTACGEVVRAWSRHRRSWLSAWCARDVDGVGFLSALAQDVAHSTHRAVDEWDWLPAVAAAKLGVSALHPPVGPPHNIAYQVSAAHSLKSYLEAHPGWVLVFEDITLEKWEEIQPLLPTKGGVILLSTSDYAVAPHARRVEFGTLKDGDFHALFQSRNLLDSMQAGEAAMRLQPVLQSNMLATTIACGNMMMLNRQVQSFSWFINDDAHVPDTVEGAIAASLSELLYATPSHRRLLVALALMNRGDGVPTEFLAQAAQLSDESVRRMVHELVRAGIVRRAYQGVRMHPTVADIIVQLDLSDGKTMVHACLKTLMSTAEPDSYLDVLGEIDFLKRLAPMAANKIKSQAQLRLAERYMDIWQLREAKDLLTRLETAKDSTPAVRESAILALGRLASAQGDTTEAIKRYQFLLKKSPSPRTASLANVRLGNIAYELQNYKMAQEHFEAAALLFTKSQAIESPAGIDLILRLGNCAAAQRQFTTAQQYYNQAFHLGVKIHGETSPKMIPIMDTIAQAYMDAKEWTVAFDMFDKLREVLKLQSPKSLQLADVMDKMTSCLRAMGRHAEADSWFKQTVAMKVAVYGAGSVQAADVLNNAAAVAYEHGDKESAMAFFESAKKSFQTVYGADSIAVAAVLNNMALLALETGKPQDAEQLFSQALAIAVAKQGANSDLAASIRQGQAKLPPKAVPEAAAPAK